MKYAFAYEIVCQVIGPNSDLSEEELNFIEEQFPKNLLSVLRLDNSEEREVLFKRACNELPQRMTVEERLELIGMFFAASSLKGEMLFQEFSILTVAAEFLEVPLDLMTRYIDQLLSDRTMPELDMEDIFKEAYEGIEPDPQPLDISLMDIEPIGRFPPGFKTN